MNVTESELICTGIKKIRKQLNLTLSDVAERTGFSVSYLSKVERNMGNLTIDAMTKICAAFNIDLVEFLSMDFLNDVIHVRNGENKVIFNKEGLMKYELLTYGNKKNLKGLRITLYPDKGPHYTKVALPHTTDELAYILEGEMVLAAVDKDEKTSKYHLKTGDSFYLYAGQKHGLKCYGNKPCVSLWSYISPPCFSMTDYLH